MSGGCSGCGGFDGLDGRTPVCRCGTGWAKPRKRLTRRTPLGHGTKGLSRGTGLAQGKGLTRSAPPADRAPIARTAPTPKPRRPRVSTEVADVVLARAGGRCEAGATPECRARGRSLTSVVGASKQHRRPAQMGGSKRPETHRASNLLMVCGSGTTGCHGHMESERTEALEAGWLVPQGVDPASVPVRLWDGRRVLLDDTGGYVDAQRVPEPTA